MSENVDEQIDGVAWDEGATATESATPEGDELQTLRQELDGARLEAADNHDKYLRALADMDNYKKRIERTYADLSRSAKKDLLGKLLSVKDNIERALQYGESSNADGESLIEGVRLTQYQLDQLLQQEGVKPIEAQGKPFDPHTQEAVHTVNDPSVPDHTVVQVVRAGYTYQDETLRPAQVVVSVHENGE